MLQWTTFCGWTPQETKKRTNQSDVGQRSYTSPQSGWKRIVLSCVRTESTRALLGTSPPDLCGNMHWKDDGRRMLDGAARPLPQDQYSPRKEGTPLCDCVSQTTKQ